MCTLGDVCDIVLGVPTHAATLLTVPGSGLGVVLTAQVKAGRVLAPVKYYTGTTPVAPERTLRVGDIVLVTSGKNSIGNVAFVPAGDEQVGAGFTEFISVLRVKDSTVVCPEFIYHLLCGVEFEHYCKARTESLLVVTLNKAYLSRFGFRLPDLTTQRETAEWLHDLFSGYGPVPGEPTEELTRRMRNLVISWVILSSAAK